MGVVSECGSATGWTREYCLPHGQAPVPAPADTALAPCWARSLRRFWCHPLWLPPFGRNRHHTSAKKPSPSCASDNHRALARPGPRSSTASMSDRRRNPIA